MPKNSAKKGIKVRMPDDASLRIVRTILTYESVVRGRRLGQTLCELVLEAVDIDEYPEEVKERLAEIEKQSAREQVERFLEWDEDW